MSTITNPPPTIDPNFPCSLTIDLPLPTTRLATSALRTLSVDAELSPLVRRSFAVLPPPSSSTISAETAPAILRTVYTATTNRMLRVAVNGFMESLGVVIGVMEELDVDVLEEQDTSDGKAEGVEFGMKGEGKERD